MKLPLTVIGGYLGAGKTTLINGILRDTDSRRIAVLVNEFGALPIDADLIEGQAGSVMSLAGGCVCCAFGGDLSGALSQLASMEPGFDHLLLEASGVAIPASVALNVSLHADVALDGIAVLVDAEKARAQAADKYIGDTILRQIEGADIVVLTKGDLAGEAALVDARDWVSDVAGHAAIVSAEFGAIPNSVILAPQTGARTDTTVQDHGTQYESHVLGPSTPIPIEDFAKDLATGGHGILRAKGFVRHGCGDTMLVQIVGNRWTVSSTPEATPTGLVCIGLAGQLSVSAIETALAECTS